MDLHYDVKRSRALAPQVATDNTPLVSEILDTANFADNELLIQLGTIADADMTAVVLLEEGNESDLSDNSAVADEDMLGTEAEAGFNYGDDNETRKLGYIGAKRYIRATITPSNNTGNLPISATWEQGGAHKSPVS